MKRNLLAFLLAVLVLLPSCLKGDFSAYSSTYERSIAVVDGIPTDLVKLSVDLSDKDASYTFRITSPDDVLSWEGKLYPEEGLFVSDDLLITPGVLFPEGEYHIQINADSGATKETTISIPSVEEWKLAEDIKDDSDIVITYYGEDGSVNEKKEGSVSASFDYVDRFRNHIFVTENY